MKDLIKQFIIICLVALAMVTARANATDITIDPAIMPTKTIICTLPIERIDGTPLAVGEIASIDFHIGRAPGNYTDVVVSQVPTPGCRLVIDTTKLPDGDYYYAATTNDTDGRISDMSNERSLTVKRLARPVAPILGWQ